MRPRVLAAASLDQGGADLDYATLAPRSDAELRELVPLAEAAGNACGGAWSVDILETRRGWFVTDMAEAYKSWHEWPECRNDFRETGIKEGAT